MDCSKSTKFGHFKSEKKVKKVKKKSRTGSEASSFDQKTIQEFKEAFGIMDQDKDGVISKQDLKDLYATLGAIASDSQIDNMLKEAPGPINFTVFLTLFGERLTGQLTRSWTLLLIRFLLILC